MRRRATLRQLIANVISNASDAKAIPLSLIWNLFNSSELSTDHKTNLFIAAISRLSKDECKEVLEMLELTEFKKLLEPRKRPNIEVNATNKKLLEAFTSEKIIYNFETDDKPGYYKIIRSQPVSKTLPDDLL